MPEFEPLVSADQPLPDFALRVNNLLFVRRCEYDQRWSLRVRRALAELISRRTRVNLSNPALHALRCSDGDILNLGPDEWFVLLPPESKLLEELNSPEFEPLVLAEVTDRQIGIRIEGLKCEEALSVFCPLDTHVSRFPVGHCTRTVFGDAGITLWRVGDNIFHLETARSFANYVWDALTLASEEISIASHTPLKTLAC